MRVFISWSGSTSKKLAEIFREWIPAVIQIVKPYFSPDDINKGARWYTEISKELEQSKVGLICLTRENTDEPWIMFEAGALSKSVDKSRVIPLLFGINSADLKGPLLQFQAAVFGKDEVKKLLKTINQALGELALDAPVLDAVYEKWWPDLEKDINDVLKEQHQLDRAVLRTDRELLEEVLNTVRVLNSEMRTAYVGCASKFFAPIDILGLRIDTSTMLKKLDIRYLGQLVQRTEQEMLMLKAFGRSKVLEIKEALDMLGLHLGTRIDFSPEHPLDPRNHGMQSKGGRTETID